MASAIRFALAIQTGTMTVTVNGRTAIASRWRRANTAAPFPGHAADDAGCLWGIVLRGARVRKVMNGTA